MHIHKWIRDAVWMMISDQVHRIDYKRCTECGKVLL